MEGGIFIDDETDPDGNSEVAAIKRTRAEPQAVALRENIFAAIRGVVEIWSLDVEVSHVRSPQSSASDIISYRFFGRPLATYSNPLHAYLQISP